MKKGLTKVVMLVDKSGSMDSIKHDVIGGFNSFLEEQKALPGTCHLSMYFFNNMLQPGALGADIQYVQPWSPTYFRTGGNTALYDALSQVIDEVGSEIRVTNEKDRPEKVLFVIITDGEENASVKATKELVAKKIKHQTEKYNWNFLYLGANQDAWKVGTGLNIINTVQFDSSPAGVRKMSAAYSTHTSNARTT